ncbi:MAG: HAD family hydrolase [Lentimicrobiaceae bacterium]|nr:HAD family hydrolase [Lentimicrobiaceae bacterium]
MSLKDLNIDRQWTLFLDRDGIINRLRVDDYVKCWEEFEFLPGVLEAIPVLNSFFDKLIIVTNQQGIGKGIVKPSAVEEVHRKMLEAVFQAGGKIHGIYVCPNLERDHHPCRKPDTGMALQAKKDFPRIEFHRSIMLGDSESDMEFGRRLGMVNILIMNNIQKTNIQTNLYDLTFPDLFAFTMEIKKHYL